MSSGDIHATNASSSSMPDESPPSDTSLSLPHFLRKVYASEINGLDPTTPQVVIMAVHSVFLESGFLAFDPGLKTDGIRLPEGWASTLAASTVRIRYTLPSLLNSERDSAVQSVVLSFQFLGNSVVVYGCLHGRRSNLVRLFLDATRFVPSIGFVLKNTETGSLEAAHESRVFEFWKTVKDGLSLPLLISICDAAGLPSPPCFMVIHIDAKFRILDFLSGVDVARTACVCSEMRYLASNDDLWRKKCVEEFGGFIEGRSLEGRWKQNFAEHWKRKKECEFRQTSGMRLLPYLRRGPFPFGAPGTSVVGGDYDRLPPVGLGPYYLPSPTRNPRRFFTSQQYRTHCDLGGFDV